MFNKILNQKGIEQFKNYLVNVNSGFKDTYPSDLLEKPEFYEELDFSLNLKEGGFKNRFEIGVEVVTATKSYEKNLYELPNEFWSTLAYYWFNELCPEKNGIRKVFKPYNYIMTDNFDERHRHAIYNSWELVKHYGDDSLFLLSKLEQRGELIEQLLGRQDFMKWEAAMKLASFLYTDKSKGTFKKGATGRTKKGVVIRYVLWLQQLSINYDIKTLSFDILKSLLPKEFEGYVNS